MTHMYICDKINVYGQENKFDQINVYGQKNLCDKVNVYGQECLYSSGEALQLRAAAYNTCGGFFWPHKKNTCGAVQKCSTVPVCSAAGKGLGRVQRDGICICIYLCICIFGIVKPIQYLQR